MRASATRFLVFARRRQRVEHDLRVVADAEAHDGCLRRTARRDGRLHGQPVTAKKLNQFGPRHRARLQHRAKDNDG